MLIEPVIANLSVVGLDIGVLLRIAPLDKYHVDTVLFRPGGQGMSDIFRAVVTFNRLGFAAPLNDPIKRSDNTQGRQRDIHLDRLAFSVEVFNDVELAEAPAIRQFCGIKSIDHISLTMSCTAKVAGVYRLSRLLGLIRRLRAS